MSDAPLPDLEHLRLLLDQVDQRIADQRDEWDGLERKATAVLATTGVLLGLVVNHAEAFVATRSPGPTLFVVALTALVGGLIAGVMTLWPRRFTAVPEPGPFLDRHSGAATDFTMGTLVSTKADAFKANLPTLRRKLWLVRTQMGLLSGASVLFVVVVVLGEVVM
jgi:hypothetical protein